MRRILKGASRNYCRVFINLLLIVHSPVLQPRRRLRVVVNSRVDSWLDTVGGRQRQSTSRYVYKDIIKHEIMVFMYSGSPVHAPTVPPGSTSAQNVSLPADTDSTSTLVGTDSESTFVSTDGQRTSSDDTYSSSSDGESDGETESSRSVGSSEYASSVSLGSAEDILVRIMGSISFHSRFEEQGERILPTMRQRSSDYAQMKI